MREVLINAKVNEKLLRYSLNIISQIYINITTLVTNNSIHSET